jgi:hypothetical protein
MHQSINSKITTLIVEALVKILTIQLTPQSSALTKGLKMKRSKSPTVLWD